MFAAPACADDDPAFTIGSKPAWLLLGGVTTGGTIALADKGAFVGGELSLARLRDGNFVGVYADGYYDWGAHGTYMTGGLELGHKFVGLDGGVALRFADGDKQRRRDRADHRRPRHGRRVRCATRTSGT